MAKLRKFYDLDNAAKIFPVVANESRSYVFRLSIVLKEVIDKKILEEALLKTVKRFRHINVRIRRGFFWFYFEENIKNPIVYEENGFINQYINPRDNNDFLFKTFYYKNRLSVEFFHALTDGKGALEFINSLAHAYLTLLGHDIDTEGLIKTTDDIGSYEEIEDRFKTLYHKQKIKKFSEPKAYHLKGTKYANHYNAIMHAYLNIDELKVVAKKYQATITEFFAAIIILAQLRSGGAQKYKKLFRVFIPINLRQFYPSVTMRNFASFVRLDYDLNKRTDDLSNIISFVKENMKKELEEEALVNRIVGNVSIEKNPLLRAVPLPVKVAAMRMVYARIGETLNSYDISNLGRVEVPSQMKEHISHYQFTIATSNDTPKAASVISFENTLCLSFISKIIERGFEQAFFRILKENNLNIQVESSNWEVI